jgi:hypothetical protein
MSQDWLQAVAFPERGSTWPASARGSRPRLAAEIDNARALKDTGLVPAGCVILWNL